MHLQVEDPSVPAPLATLAEDYGQAVLHIAWDRNTRTNVRTLVFAFVEMLPHEIPPPLDDYDPKGGHRLTGASVHHVHVRHAVLTAAQALDWYLACREEVAILPENDGALPARTDPAAKRLELARLGEDPAWPRLVTWSPEHTALPFCPHWAKSPRLHSLVPLAPFDLQALWSTPQERASAADKLRDLLHFDLRDDPELWGSIHLLLPNPVYRERDGRLRHRMPPAESELVRFQPRAGKRVDGLELIVQERRPWGPTDVRRVTVQSPLLELRSPTTIHARRTEVWDPRRGMLESPEGMHIFIGGFNLGIGLGQATRVRGRAPEDRYEVVRSQYTKIRVGDDVAPAASAHSRLVGAHFEKRAREAARRHGQRWFHGEKEEARAHLRSLLLEARREVWIVDPYFGADELIGFLPAVANVEVPIFVLTSAERLRNHKGEKIERPEDVEPPPPSTVEASDLFAAQLPGLRRDLQNPLHVRVMTGSRPDIHDRFLVIDDRVFSVGSSLDELGQRGTLILGVHDPEPIRNSLREAWRDAQDFEPWYEDRRAHRGDPVDDGTREAAE